MDIKPGILMTLIGWIICGLIGGLCFPYAITTFAFLFEWKVIELTFFHGFLLGLIPGIGQLSIPAWALAFVCKLILVV